MPQSVTVQMEIPSELYHSLEGHINTLGRQEQTRLQSAPYPHDSTAQWLLENALYSRRNVVETVSSEVEIFIPVVEKFVETCEFAPTDMRGNSPDSGVISIHGNGDDTIPRVNDDTLNPTNCEYRGKNSQGAVYALTQLPHLRDVDEMARDELLHSSTVDAWKGDAFRKSRIEIEERYLATAPV